MKKTAIFSKAIPILFCILAIILLAGCGGTVEGAVASITNYITTPPRDVQIPSRANFVGFQIEAEGDRYGYKIGYAVIQNGVRRDNILYTYTPSPNDDFRVTRCAFIIAGNFLDEEIRIQHIQSGDGWSYTSDMIDVTLPELSGYLILTRSSDFEAMLLIGDDLVLASVIGSADNEILRPTTLDIFDNYRTIDDALNDPNKADRPFLLIFYISAIQ